MNKTDDIKVTFNYGSKENLKKLKEIWCKYYSEKINEYIMTFPQDEKTIIYKNIKNNIIKNKSTIK